MACRALMVGGTASHVGKSWMATAICRWLYRRGVNVAPFKAQNMSNNSYPCAAGGEIGRAQVAQAEACGLEPHPDMNPILLKPTSERSSQVVVQGRVWRDLSAQECYEHHEYLAGKVQESFERLSSEYDFVVVEGAGSIAELNLQNTDIVNLGFARRFQVPTLLVADIDRGGVFAAVYGTIDLLAHGDRQLVRAFAINRFRGDPALFEEGKRLLEDKTAKPCLGVFPYAADIQVDQEDSVMLDSAKPQKGARRDVAILRFPRISNLTDFRLLSSASWIEGPVNSSFKSIILPGSKNTAADLQWMRSRNLDRWLLDQHNAGARILGICGGYQMLGESIEDPDGVESEHASTKGLGLLPIHTVLLRDKVTRRVQARTPGGVDFAAYEIHMGHTVRPDNAQPVAYVDGRSEGMQLRKCAGCYLHGALENPEVVEEWLGFRPADPLSKDNSYDNLAIWFERSADIPLFDRLFLA